MGDDELEMREKYPKAADLLDSAIQVICDAYNLKPTGPAHDVAEWMLIQFFVEGEE